MSKYIEVSMGEKTFKLQFSRSSIKMMEEKGFRLDEVGDKILTSVDLMVYGALKMYQPLIKEEKAYEISEYLCEEYGVKEIMEKLVELYTEVFHLEGKGKKLKVMG